MLGKLVYIWISPHTNITIYVNLPINKLFQALTFETTSVNVSKRNN